MQAEKRINKSMFVGLVKVTNYGGIYLLKRIWAISTCKVQLV